MCGIAGIIRKNNNLNFSKTVNEFEKSVFLMSHRGPDSYGKYIDENIALFHYRLKIIDLNDRSNQPFKARDDNLIGVYNGEVYNFKELRDDNKIHASTTSDTEILIKTFGQYGVDIIKKWNGIFSICMYDKKFGIVTLARDRFGVKPLYYLNNNNYFVFASEAKVIFDWLESIKINYQGIVEYLWQGCTISNITMVEGVKKIEPGSWIRYDINNNKTYSEKFWEFSFHSKKDISLNEAVENTRLLLDKAVKRQLISDVPLAVFLSGGIDSSAITAYAAKNHSRRIKTYSVEFDYETNKNSELKNAEIIANTFNTEHHELRINANGLEGIIETLVFQHDEPFADAANIPLFILTQKLNNEIKVVLQGDGGDEIFGGYRKYAVLAKENFWKYLTMVGQYILPSKMDRNRAQRLFLALSQKEDYMKMALMTMAETLDNSPLKLINEDLFKSKMDYNPFNQYERNSSSMQFDSIAEKMMFTDVKIKMANMFMDKVDKATMLNSIEARVPLLDNDLTSYVMSLPFNFKINNGDKKYLLKCVLRGLIPDKILDSPKKGFGVPFDQWLKTSLFDYMNDTFNSSLGKEIINQKLLKEVIEQHQNSYVNHGYLLWKLLILVSWMNRYKNKVSFN